MRTWHCMPGICREPVACCAAGNLPALCCVKSAVNRQRLLAVAMQSIKALVGRINKPRKTDGIESAELGQAESQARKRSSHPVLPAATSSNATARQQQPIIQDAAITAAHKGRVEHEGQVRDVQEYREVDAARREGQIGTGVCAVSPTASSTVKETREQREQGSQSQHKSAMTANLAARERSKMKEILGGYIADTRPHGSNAARAHARQVAVKRAAAIDTHQAGLQQSLVQMQNRVCESEKAVASDPTNSDEVAKMHNLHVLRRDLQLNLAKRGTASEQTQAVEIKFQQARQHKVLDQQPKRLARSRVVLQPALDETMVKLAFLQEVVAKDSCNVDKVAELFEAQQHLEQIKAMLVKCPTSKKCDEEGSKAVVVKPKDAVPAAQLKLGSKSERISFEILATSSSLDIGSTAVKAKGAALMQRDQELAQTVATIQKTEAAESAQLMQKLKDIKQKVKARMARSTTRSKVASKAVPKQLNMAKLTRMDLAEQQDYLYPLALDQWEGTRAIADIRAFIHNLESNRVICNVEVRAAFFLLRADEADRPREMMKLDLHSPQHLRVNPSLRPCDRYMSPLQAADALKVWVKILAEILFAIVPEQGATVVTGKGDGRVFAAVGNALQQLQGQGRIKDYEQHRKRVAYTFRIIPAAL